MKHTKFSNNLIKLSLFMIIVTSLFATISCENDAVGSSSAGNSSKLPDISDVGRSISVAANGILVKWNPPTLTGTTKDDGTPLTVADISYEFYYLEKGTANSSDGTIADIISKATTATPAQKITKDKNTQNNTQALIPASKLSGKEGKTFEIVIVAVNGSKKSGGVKFEVLYKADNRPTGLSTTPSNVRFFTTTAVKTGTGQSAVHSITVTVLDPATANNEYFIFHKKGATDTIANVKSANDVQKMSSSSGNKTHTLDNLDADSDYLIVVQQVFKTTDNKYTSTEAMAKEKTKQ